MLILHALGVPEHRVLKHYLLTNVTLDYERVLLPKLTTRYGDAMALDRESVMARAAARERLRARYLA